MTKSTQDDTQDGAHFYIVGIGASAGGLDALVRFFSELPDRSGMAFVVVQHLSPDHKSLMPELLAKHTAMPVQHAEDGAVVQPDHVYLIPPRKDITIYHGTLYLAEQDRSAGRVNFPIDLFFESLANDRGDRAIAIILSGTGSDGTRGIRAVKDAGGLILVQKSETAQYSGMPHSATRTGLVDQVLAPEAMSEALTRFIEAPRRTRALMETQAHRLQEEDGFGKILALLRHRFAVDFSAYKPTTVTRRIEHRMNITQQTGFDAYARYLEAHPEEVKTLYRDLLIGVTRFFRDREAFEALDQKVVPALVKAARERQARSVRVWVPGCSTGEEAYSVAMLFHDRLQAHDGTLELKIFATDIDQGAIDRAAAGAYPDSIVADLDPDYLRRYFVKIGGQYQIIRELRESVIFAPHNLLKDPPFSKLDLISCRNLLIYLKPKTQEQVLSSFSYALREGGYLFLGSSENVTSGGFGLAAVSTKHRLYQQRWDQQGPRRVIYDMVPRRGDADATREDSGARSSPTRLVEALFADLLGEYLPPAVLVDERHRVLHVFGDANRYLRVPSGTADMDLLKMVPADLQMLLGTALHKAQKEDDRVVYPEVAVGEGEARRRFDLTVGVEQTQEGDTVFLIVFDDVSPDADVHYPETERTYDIEAAAQERIRDLDRKLRYTEENLQATVEELETSNEELQATNEELMAANEELQSTNEELHSVNEELITVNAELQEKIRQLTELNNDMENLLQIMEVSTIFLDAELCVRKFTASAGEYVHLMPADEGRPIHHFSHVFAEVDLQQCAQEVMQQGTPIEREVRDEDGGAYQLRVLPYWTPEEVVKGVVLAFRDVTEVQQLRRALADAQASHEAPTTNAEEQTDR